MLAQQNMRRARRLQPRRPGRAGARLARPSESAHRLSEGLQVRGAALDLYQRQPDPRAPRGQALREATGVIQKEAPWGAFY